MLFGLIGGYIEDSQAGTAVSLRESYAGNLSFELTGGSFRTTQNNTSACTLASTSSGNLTTLPVKADIKKAYLYWAASSDGFNVDNTVTLNGITIVADRMYTEDTGSWDFFNGVADVTSIINSQRNGIYTLSNLDIYSTFSHCLSQTTLGGWALAIIYEDDSVPFHVLNLYEGFQSYQNSTVTLIPDNFKLPSNPSGKHAHITWEGDDTLGTDGEYLAFEGVRLTDSGNPSNNQFNSYSNVQGGFTSYGVDIDEYDISPYLTAGAESVSTVYSAGQDLVLLSAELVSVANIPVADLAVTTSNPSAWTQGTQVTKKFTISNNGPNDVPTQSVRFSTTLPAQLSLASLPNDSDWLCNQSGQTLTCIYQNKLRSGWSDYLDVTFDVANGTAGSTVNWNVTVDHDLAPYDIFDNHAENDTKNLSVPISSVPVVDLSASSKTYTNLSGDLLLAGDTLRYVITIDDVSNLASSNIRVTDNLPANITGYTILALPTGATNNSTTTGGSNGNGILDISNISLAAGATEQIIFEVTIDANAAKGASLQNQATLTQAGIDWIVDTGDITVVEPDLSTSVKAASDVNGGWLLPDDVINYTITLTEKEGLDLVGVNVTDHLPKHIKSFAITQLPPGAVDASQSTGGNNGTGYIDIRNISLASGASAVIEIEAIIDESAIDQFNMKNTATVSVNSKNWTVESNDLFVTLSNSTPATGNKPLYLSGSDLTRIIPAANSSRSFRHGQSLTWALTPVLQSDFVLSAGQSRFNMAIVGYRTGNVQTQFNATLYYNDNNGSGNVTIDSANIPYGNYRRDTAYNIFTDFDLADDVTVPEGSTLYLRVDNIASNGSNNQWSQIDVFQFNGNFYSAVNLNAKTVINVDAISVWDTPYGDPTGSGDGTQLANSLPDTTLYIRANISDPFGAFDITKATIDVTKADSTGYDFSANPNSNEMIQVDTTADDLITSSKTYELPITLQEENESIGWWQIAVTGYEGQEVAPNQVTHERVGSFLIKPFLPQIGLTKTVSVINDPVNGTSNPKAIPGAELMYTINGINTGRGKSDNNSIKMIDEIPANSELYIGDINCNNRGPGTGLGPVCFIDGTTPHESGLSFNFATLDNLTDGVQFSTDGSDFSYIPDLTNGDYDAAIRFIRIEPVGTYNNQPKDGSKQPEFSFSYRVRLN